MELDLPLIFNKHLIQKYMKKITLFIAFMFTIATYAQDIIITKKSERIDAKITEVGTTEIKYKLKDNTEGQELSIKKAEVSSIIYSNGNIDTFNESATTYKSTITDIEGNVYTTIIIGNQEWTVENWKCTKYNDGTDIPLIADNKLWSTTSGAAMCFYYNKEENKEILGGLYNWYSVKTGKLAPDGWRVPSEEDWLKMRRYLITNGYNFDDSKGRKGHNKIAKAMADVNNPYVQWEKCSAKFGLYIDGCVCSAYAHMINKSGFSALPSGCRGENGFCFNKSYAACWWSSSKSQLSNNDLAPYFFIGYKQYLDQAWQSTLTNYEKLALANSEITGSGLPDWYGFSSNKLNYFEGYGLHWSDALKRCGLSVRMVRDL